VEGDPVAGGEHGLGGLSVGGVGVVEEGRAEGGEDVEEEPEADEEEDVGAGGTGVGCGWGVGEPWDRAVREGSCEVGFDGDGHAFGGVGGGERWWWRESVERHGGGTQGAG